MLIKYYLLDFLIFSSAHSGEGSYNESIFAILLHLLNQNIAQRNNMVYRANSRNYPTTYRL